MTTPCNPDATAPPSATARLRPMVRHRHRVADTRHPRNRRRRYQMTTQTHDAADVQAEGRATLETVRDTLGDAAAALPPAVDRGREAVDTLSRQLGDQDERDLMAVMTLSVGLGL